MVRGAKIPKCLSGSLSKKIIKYKNPKHVYIPLISQNDTNVTVLVKQGDKVNKGDIIARRRGSFRVPIHSSVSGKVTSFVEKPYINGNNVKCVVIENDLQESVNIEKTNNKVISDFTKEEFIIKIRDAGIVGLGGGGFPTYVKYDTDIKINTLIINALECEPFISADYMLVMEKCEEILEGIDAVLEINDIQEAIIAVNKKNTSLIEKINTFIGTYIKIKLVTVPNIYPMGWERTLIKQVKHVNYNKLPIEKGIVVNNISTMFAIYEALKFNKPLIERVVTITGDMIKSPQNVVVKIGTPLKEVIELVGYEENSEVQFIAGGPMMGEPISSLDLIMSSNLTGILLNKGTVKKDPIDCLRCGKCVEVCPAKLSPVMIMDKLDSKDLKWLRPENCVECGLCTYICPSKINVRKKVVCAKEIIWKGESL